MIHLREHGSFMHAQLSYLWSLTYYLWWELWLYNIRMFGKQILLRYIPINFCLGLWAKSPGWIFPASAVLKFRISAVISLVLWNNIKSCSQKTFKSPVWIVIGRTSRGKIWGNCAAIFTKSPHSIYFLSPENLNYIEVCAIDDLGLNFALFRTSVTHLTIIYLQLLVETGDSVILFCDFIYYSIKFSMHLSLIYFIFFINCYQYMAVYFSIYSYHLVIFHVHNGTCPI